MFGVVMAGGRSSRMGREKPMLEYRGKKFLDISCDAVMGAGLKCLVAVSKNAPETFLYARERYEIIETSGLDYCNDIKYVLDYLGEPFLSVVSDIPFITAQDLIAFLENYSGGSVAGAVLEKNEIVYVGINIVSSDLKDKIFIFENKKLSVNINTMDDYRKIIDY